MVYFVHLDRVLVGFLIFGHFGGRNDSWRAIGRQGSPDNREVYRVRNQTVGLRRSEGETGNNKREIGLDLENKGLGGIERERQKVEAEKDFRN